jgi:hypothetical protein
MFTMRTSIHGRRLGLSSTGGLLASAGESTAQVAAAQMWGSGMLETIASTGGATLLNYGVSVIATTATAATFLLGAPVAGLSKEIYIVSSGSALTFGGTSTSQVFSKIGGGTAGSTTLTLTDANLAGQALVLRGLSATKWGLMNGSTVIQA